MARTLQARFGVPSGEALRYLEVGRRFRIKSNLEPAAAQALVAELASLGAIASAVEVKTGTTLTPPSKPPPKPPAQGPSAPRPPGPPPLPPTSAARKPAPAPRAAPESSGAEVFESGLSAALSGGLGEVRLGALDQLANAQLASLDGVDEEPPRPITVAPAPPVPAASSPYLDPFAAPDAEAPLLELDVRPNPSRPRGQLAPVDAMPPIAPSEPTGPSGPSMLAEPLPLPPLVADVSPAPSAAPGRRLVTTVPRAGTTAAPPRAIARLGDGLAGIGERPRAFLLALFVGVALAYLPATLYASHTTSTRYGRIRHELEIAQSPPVSPETWAQLPALRTEAVARLTSARNRAAATTLVIWALGAAVLTFVGNRLLTRRLGTAPAPPAARGAS